MNIIKFIKRMNEVSNDMGVTYQISLSLLMTILITSGLFAFLGLLAFYPAVMKLLLVIAAVVITYTTVVNTIEIIKKVLEEE